MNNNTITNQEALEVLCAFCTKEAGEKYDFTTPFVQDGRTYANCNNAMVEYDGVLKGVTRTFVGSAVSGHIERMFSELEDYQTYELADIPSPVTHEEHPMIECENCNGTGKVGFVDVAGNKYSCVCMGCAGDGMSPDLSKPSIIVTDRTAVILCGCWFFDARYLKLLREKLHGLKLLIPRKMLEASEMVMPPVLCLSWDCGRALLMPLRNYSLTISDKLLSRRCGIKESEASHE